MSAQMLLENFELIASAPGGVKRLREMILHLALIGRLSIQRSGEDALELLSLLESEKEKITGVNQSPQGINKHSPIFSLPNSWVWTNLGRLSENIHYGVTAKAIQRKNGVRFLRITDIQNDRVNWASVPSCDIEEKQLNSGQLHNGDILIARTGGTIGKTYLVENLSQQVIFASYLIRFIPLNHTNSKYVKLFTNSPLYWEQLREVSLGTGQPNVNATALKALHIPLPPLEEQKRIVAKVDELMALCDKLEAQQQERERRFPMLSRTCHARFLESPSLANLKVIFDEAESVSIEDLRKTVITLAVQGKLISQNLDDDSVDELLDKISNQNTLQKAIPKSRKLKVPETEPFNIPKSWRWIQLGQIANLIEYGTSYKADSNSKNIPIYRMGNIQNGNISDSNLKYVPSDIAELPKLYLEPMDILFNRTNSWELVGKAGIYKGSAQSHTFASYLIRIRLPNNHLEADFFNLCFLAPYFRTTQIEPALTQQCGQANFNGTKLANSLFPLPPHNEQRRIVAKVDQLMALIDKLEAQQEKKSELAQAFAQAAVAAITGTETKEPEKMKAPKTELVSCLQTRHPPNATDLAPESCVS